MKTQERWKESTGNRDFPVDRWLQVTPEPRGDEAAETKMSKLHKHQIQDVQHRNIKEAETSMDTSMDAVLQDSVQTLERPG